MSAQWLYLIFHLSACLYDILITVGSIEAFQIDIRGSSKLSHKARLRGTVLRFINDMRSQLLRRRFVNGRRLEFPHWLFWWVCLTSGVTWPGFDAGWPGRTYYGWPGLFGWGYALSCGGSERSFAGETARCLLTSDVLIPHTHTQISLNNNNNKTMAVRQILF